VAFGGGEEIAHDVGGLLVGFFCGVGVDAEGGGAVGVAEAVGDGGDGDACVEELGGAEVAEVVQADVFEAGFFAGAAEDLGEFSGGHGVLAGGVVAEDEAVGVEADCESVAEVFACCAMGRESLCGVGVEGEGADGVGFGVFEDMGFVGAESEALGDVECAGCGVEV